MGDLPIRLSEEPQLGIDDFKEELAPERSISGKGRS
jgi:hypothetical protein